MDYHHTKIFVLGLIAGFSDNLFVKIAALCFCIGEIVKDL